MYCSIALPLQLLQMDHQRPQIGGEIEAITKTLQILGFTAQPPLGEKCVQVVTRINISNSAGHLATFVLCTELHMGHIKGYPVHKLTRYYDTTNFTHTATVVIINNKSAVYTQRTGPIILQRYQAFWVARKACEAIAAFRHQSLATLRSR